MRFVSTRGGAPPVGFSEALRAGIAPDGGLYVPERFPVHDPDRFDPAAPLPDFAALVLAPFFEGDPLAGGLGAVCAGAFTFPVPLVAPERTPGGAMERTAVLELFHGPTAAFKDVGARFLAGCLLALDAGTADSARGGGPQGGERGPRTVLVATSGDTGGAVASAFHGQPGVEVVILFPRGGVSGRQEHQLTAWGGNVRAFAVRGTFDDCQRMLKAALADGEFRTGRRLTTANSINIARLLPQTVYYARAALAYRRERGTVPGFIVPSGNVGNATAALWAREMGFPVGHLVLAANANRPLPDYFATGRFTPRPSVRTLANAMDVGNPSNLERVRALFPELDALRHRADAVSVDDDTIRAVIAAGPERWGRVWDPHTATAVHVREALPTPDWIVVATAHPAKFDSVVEPLVGHAIPVPPALAAILARPARSEELEAEPAALRRALA